MKRTPYPHLAAPGPVPVPERVRQAMSGALPHHRTPAFSDILAEVHDGLRWLYQTEHDVLVMTGSGSTGMEAAVVNFADPQGQLLCIGGGKFGERWGAIARGYGLDVVDQPVVWGEAADPGELAALLDANPGVTAVTLTAVETSTGVRHPLEALCDVVRAREGVLMLVDGITAVGAMDVPMDKLGVDVLITGSQKIYAVPPGLTFLGVSPRAWARQPSPGVPRYGLDMVRERDAQRRSQTAFSPAISLIMGAREALALLREEGREAMWARHRRNAAAVRAGVQALGLSLLAKVPCDSVTAVKVPEALDGLALLEQARALGVIFAGGQGDLKGRIFRIGHLGSHDRGDVIHALATLELTLHAQGWPLRFGAGVGAALAVFAA